VFQVALSNRAEKGLKKYRDSRSKLLELFAVLKENPIPADSFDVCKIEDRSDTYRVRLGDMRVVYGMDWGRRSVVILHFLPRGRVYKGS
jgi:mRNA interferase RelE/StbE